MSRTVKTITELQDAVKGLVSEARRNHVRDEEIAAVLAAEAAVAKAGRREW